MISDHLRRTLPLGARKIWRRYQGSAFKWRYVDNWASTLAYRLHAATLGGEHRRVLDDLERDGFASTTVDQLFGSDTAFRELTATVSRLDAEQRSAIDDARAASVKHAADHKSYLHMFIGVRNARLSRDHGFVTFAEPVHAIADAYFGMRTELKQVDVWYNFATPHAPRASQFWHRDREDRHILKMFVYLDNVAEDTGPLTYALGSHRERSIEPESFREPGHGNARTTNEQMARVIPEERWKQAVGPKGSIIFADTAGYHRGGDVRIGERQVYMCMFTSPACREQMLVVDP